MRSLGAGRLDGIGADAGDLLRVFVWAFGDEPELRDRNLLAEIYLRYPSSSRITVPMVEEFLQETVDPIRVARGLTEAPFGV